LTAGPKKNSYYGRFGMTIQDALDQLTALGHIVERRTEPMERNGVRYFRVDGQFRSERQIFDYLITGKSLLTPFELERGHRPIGEDENGRETRKRDWP
jgi:hypothetical protein